MMSEVKLTVDDSKVEVVRSATTTEAMVDAAAERLALFWPTRGSAMCTVGMPIEERRRLKHIAREVLLIAEAWRGVERRPNPFLDEMRV